MQRKRKGKRQTDKERGTKGAVKRGQVEEERQGEKCSETLAV